MANQEQLEILKQGVEVWNKWRDKNNYVEVDLIAAHLNGIELIGANLTEASLIATYLDEANLREADLSRANLSGATLSKTDLRGASLSRATLYEAKLIEANLIDAKLDSCNLIKACLFKANLKAANLMDANLVNADLRDVNFSKAMLIGANFTGSNLRGSDFANGYMGGTIFGDSDLSKTKGLDDVHHFRSSYISTDSLVFSKGNIPEVFLRGCGLGEWEIEFVKLYQPDLSNNKFIDIQNRIFDLRNRQAIQISPLFISYSHADSLFVDKMEKHLNKKGVRFWRDIHDMKAGRIEKQIDRAIIHNPTVLLVLSKKSIKSDWVEHEVRTARELEKEMERDVLCPVALDDSWKDSRWPKWLMEQVMNYHVLDFSDWQDDSKFEGMFRRLVDGLELFYKR